MVGVGPGSGRQAASCWGQVSREGAGAGGQAGSPCPSADAGAPGRTPSLTQAAPAWERLPRGGRRTATAGRESAGRRGPHLLQAWPQRAPSQRGAPRTPGSSEPRRPLAGTSSSSGAATRRPGLEPRTPGWHPQRTQACPGTGHGPSAGPWEASDPGDRAQRCAGRPSARAPCAPSCGHVWSHPQLWWALGLLWSFLPTAHCGISLLHCRGHWALRAAVLVTCK